MTKHLVFYAFLIIISSCKSNSEEKKESIEDSTFKKKIVLDEDIKAIQQGLDNYWDVKASNETKLVVNMDKIYFIKENPTITDTTARYFLHVKLMNGELINMDFNYKDFELKSKNQSEYKDYAIAFRELPFDPIFSILTGQFNEDGRIWQEILHEQNFY